MEPSVCIFTKGMNKDSSPRMMEKGWYTEAWNATFEHLDGGIGAISNEIGNTLKQQLTEGYIPIGSILTNSNSFVIFSTDNVTSEIGLYDPNIDTYQTLVNTTCLGFKTYWPITGLFKIRNGCERVIYFTDRNNDFRTINLDKLDRYKDIDGEWNCEEFKFTQEIDYPIVQDITVQDTGGLLSLGAYSFSYRMLDEDLNATNWSILTTPVMVIDEPRSSTWSNIDGGQNIDFYNEAEGGTAKSTKSIEITFSELGDSFSYMEVAVVRYLQGLGVVTDSFVLPRKRINADTLKFTVTGSNNEIQQEIDIQELLVDKEVIQKVETVRQLENTLYLAGIQSSQYDWSKFQQAASKVVVNAVAQEVDAITAPIKGSPKSQYYMSYMGGEVYALSIAYLMKDGTLSPAFHIPGRAKTTTDSQLVSTWTPDIAHIVSQVDFNNQYAKTEQELLISPTKKSIRKWQVEDTSSNLGNNRYAMGYWESSNTYPDIKNCSNESIWGTDSAGNILENTPIRHHKFPSRRTVPLMGSSGDIPTQYQLQLEFSNIDIPDPNVIGVIFYRAERDDDNKTILDKGVLFGTVEKDEYEFNGFEFPIENRTTVFFSPRTLIDRTSLRGSYFNVEGAYDKHVRTQERNRQYNTPGFLTDRIRINVDIYNGYNKTLNHRSTLRQNLGYIDNGLVNFASVQSVFGAFDKGLKNNARNTFASFYLINSEARITASDVQTDVGMAYPLYVANKVFRDVYNNLENLIYVPIVNNPIPVENINTVTVTTGGDTVISAISISTLFNYDTSGFLNKANFDGQHIDYLWVESEYNFNLRHSGTDPCNKYYKVGSNESYADYFITKLADELGNGSYQVKNEGDICQEYYGYNKDFSVSETSKVNFPLSFVYDYCQGCVNYHPNRIYYSQSDNLESEFDNYRVVLTNNYKNLDGSGGKITELLVDKDELYALTTNFIYFIPTRAQEIRTNESVAYIGTGEKLSLPIKKLTSSQFSYGGTEQFLSVINTEFGTCYADTNIGKIFMVSSSLEEISANGMRKWFDRNLSLKLDEAVKKSTGSPYPYNKSPMHPTGIGVIGTYDPENRRIIIHKRDYLPKVELLKDITTISQTPSLYFDTTDNKFYEIISSGRGAIKREIKLTNTQYFEDISWTLSYDLVRKGWTSFHGYLPEYLFNDNNTFYSSVTNGIWRHNEGEYQTYYGEKKDFIIETLFNEGPLLHKRINSLELFSIYTEDEVEYNSRPDYLWVYNQSQSTGKLTLQDHNSLSFVTIPGIANVRTVRRKNFINDIRDYSTSNIIKGKIGILDVPINIDYNKSMFNLPMIEGDYAYIRLYFNPEKNYKIVTDALNVVASLSNR